MTPHPRDLKDLYLAPVALAVDRQLEHLSQMSAEEIVVAVELATNQEPADAVGRGAALIDTVSHAIDLRGWELSWDPRGLRLTNDEHTLVIGIGESIVDYLGE